jgi:2-polyprenyl-3-methyl-5-hydroxy-6-metoxy-1,4-benzoquinol methylase
MELTINGLETSFRKALELKEDDPCSGITPFCNDLKSGVYMTTPNANHEPGCRFCKAPLRHTFVDLGSSPLCESYLTQAQLNQVEPFYPLRTYVCGECFLVQLEAYVSVEHIFTEYAYFSSYSDTWVEHARLYTEKVIDRFGIGPEHTVVELASNDGYLLQHFLAKGISVLGIEPARNVAEVAVRKGIPTLVEFFGEVRARALAQEGRAADLIIGNNVLAQVPDLNDFIKGMAILLKPHGIITLEFPHLLRTMEGNQFDQIYHEHFSYFSFLTIHKILLAHGLTVFDVEEIPTHGGSLRVYARHSEDSAKVPAAEVTELLSRERDAGLLTLEMYSGFAEQVMETKRKLLSFLIEARNKGKRVVGYGAPGKGNTLLNYCGIRTDLLAFTVDRSPYKQGRFLPGTHIPILHPDMLKTVRPDYVLILPWNLKDEIMEQHNYIQSWGGRFVVPIPEISIYN